MGVKGSRRAKSSRALAQRCRIVLGLRGWQDELAGRRAVGLAADGKRAARHICPHITVLFPIVPPETIDPPTLDRLQHLFTAVSRFRFQVEIMPVSA